MANRKLPFEQLLRDEALTAFKLWETTENKTDY
jgi:hypothetical protein